MLAARPEVRPGELEERPNRAGNTTFVLPELVRGTLREGWKLYRSLPPGFPRAAFAMFLVSEVRPFDDGNGRVARLLMNAELTAAGQARLLIPIVYRDNYLQALRALSQNGNPTPLARTLDYAQQYAVALSWSDRTSAREQLDATNAFTDPNEADLAGLRLRLPA